MFKRPHHQRIRKLLGALNADFLLENSCLFGGGTAIVLSLDEYRESLDVDFLCASHEGYRALRSTIANNDLGSILASPLKLAREVRADRYGIRTFVEIDGQPIKFEIIREDRMTIQGGLAPEFGVPTLSRVDMYAEKLLANADRHMDKSAASRDIIDLAMMIECWGNIPGESWEKARGAYGPSVDRAFREATELVSERTHLLSCLQKMHMAEDLLESIPSVLTRELKAFDTMRQRP